MPTTSNFGWTTPADTDLVKDGAAAIRTLGNGIDTSMAELKGGTTGQVLSKTSNTDMDFTWVTTDDANAIQNAIVDAKGDLITATAADTPARLAVGTDGQVLTADSTTATGLKWAAAAAGGKVLQVVAATTSSNASSTSTTYADTNLTATITPTLSTSKILCIATIGNSEKLQSGGNTENGIDLKLLRGATSLGTITGNAYTASTVRVAIGSVTFSVLDTPATTSATTYKVQFAASQSGQTVYVQAGNSLSSIVLLEIGA